MGKSQNFGHRPRPSALNLRAPTWQSVACASAITALWLAASAAAAPTSAIATLPHGVYVCELAGDALGEAGHPIAAEGFTITHSSSYLVGNEMGSYLLTGTLLTMTSGPKQGQIYRRKSENFLRKLSADGSETSLRCIRGG